MGGPITGMGFGITAMLLISALAVADDARDCTSIAFQHALESEARERVEEEDAARHAQGLPPEYHGASWLYRYYKHLIKLLESHDRDCETWPLRAMWGAELALAKEKHERVEAHVIDVELESFEQAVANLRRHEYHPDCASMRFTNPGAVSGPILLPVEETIEAMRQEPRIARLMDIAAHGSAEDRARLLSALRADYAEHGLNVLDHEGRKVDHLISFRPLAALPLLLAELDENGEQLELLMDMTREYLQLNFGDKTPFEAALLSSTQWYDIFSGLLAHSVDRLLSKLPAASADTPHRTGCYAEVERMLHERIANQSGITPRKIEPWEYYSRLRPNPWPNALQESVPVIASRLHADEGRWKSEPTVKTALTLARGADAVAAMHGIPQECAEE